MGARFLWIIVVALTGCAASPAAPLASVTAESAVPPADVDLTRAYLSLAQIQPPVVKPKAPAERKPLSDRAARQIDRAQQLASEQRYTEASLELERALRYDPNHPQIHRALAMINWEAGNLLRALEHASRALEGDPDDAVVYYIKGRCDAAGGMHDSAITSFRTALLCGNINERPDYAVLCHYYLAESLAEEDYLEAALEQYAKFEAVAEKLKKVGASEAAKRLLRVTHGSAAEPKSEILERLDRFSAAADALAPEVARRPDDVSLGVRHARLLLTARRFPEARAAVREIPSDDQDFRLRAKAIRVPGGQRANDLISACQPGARLPLELALAHRARRHRPSDGE